MSMKFQDLIDKENMLLDSKRLSEWQKNVVKAELVKKIYKVRDEFIDNNVSSNDWEGITLIHKLTDKIKSII